jgi:hypothetical protein
MGEDSTTTVGIGLYLYAAAINHSCDPNCCQTHSFIKASSSIGTAVDSPEPTLCIRAVRDIEPDEELTISYIDTGKPTWWRREELFTSYNFICQCNRCARLDLLECYACPVPSCGGYCYVSEQSLYRLWQGLGGVGEDSSICGDGSVVLHSRTRSGSIHELLGFPVPYGDLLAKYCASSFMDITEDGGLASSPSFSSQSPKLYENKTSANSGGLQFVCSKCNYALDGVTLSRQIVSLCREVTVIRKMQLQSENIVHPTLSFLERWLKLVNPMHYSVMEVCRTLLLDELVNQGMFEQYAGVYDQYKITECLRLCYPPIHVATAIQQAMYAKTLIYLARSERDLITARQVLVSSLEILIVTHGNDADLTRDIQSMLTSLP